MSSVKYYVNKNGVYLGGFDGTEPQGCVEVETPPNHSLDIWNGASWDAYTPILTPLEMRNSALADITYTRPSDGVEIQIRDSQFFPQDEARMAKAINKLQPLETAPWISKDNRAITVTREDLVAALDYQATEIERIFTDYIATL